MHLPPPLILHYRLLTRPLVTRSHKHNDRDHAGLAAGTAAASEHLPRYFAKHGHVDVDPKKVKKEGGGKRNWGTPGEEVVDSGYTMSNERRRSNSVTARAGLDAFTTKFERRDIDADPVFEEELHGPLAEDEETESASASGVSVEEEDEAKRA